MGEAPLSGRTAGPRAARFADGRLHLHHGPIDLIVEAFGEPSEVEAASAQAEAAFRPILPELAAELRLLRRPIDELTASGDVGRIEGAVARRMVAAVAPHAGVFVTPMAAVAGAVADAVLAAMVAGRRLARAYVNDGGDIALWLAEGEAFTAGIVAEVATGRIAATARVDAASDVRGIATSGAGGRSFSLGIADAVTVLAKDAAAADAAATLIANAVNVASPAIVRAPADSLDLDSDLGSRLVTVAVGPLSEPETAAALDAGAAEAERMRSSGRIAAAYLHLRGQTRVVAG